MDRLVKKKSQKRKAIPGCGWPMVAHVVAPACAKILDQNQNPLTGVRVARLTTVPRILMMIQEEVMIQVVVMVVVLSSPPLMLLT